MMQKMLIQWILKKMKRRQYQKIKKLNQIYDNILKKIPKIIKYYAKIVRKNFQIQQALLH